MTLTKLVVLAVDAVVLVLLLEGAFIKKDLRDRLREKERQSTSAAPGLSCCILAGVFDTSRRCHDENQFERRSCGDSWCFVSS
jgi:hypothetical protein